MLQLKKILKPVDVKTTFDFYVPIDIKFIDYFSGKCIETNETTIIDYSLVERPIYWKTGLNNSIFELEMGETSGKIRSFTVVSESSVVLIQDNKKQYETRFEKQGIPAFNIDQWKNGIYYLEDEHCFELCIENNDVIVNFSSQYEIDLTLINDRINFCFDKNLFLCSVRINNMNKEEELELKDGLKARGSLIYCDKTK